MPPKRQTAKDLVREALPQLEQGTGKIKSSAIHDVKYLGPLVHWGNFQQQAILACNLNSDLFGTPTSISHAPCVNIFDFTSISRRMSRSMSAMSKMLMDVFKSGLAHS